MTCRPWLLIAARTVNNIEVCRNSARQDSGVNLGVMRASSGHTIEDVVGDISVEGNMLQTMIRSLLQRKLRCGFLSDQEVGHI